MCVHNAVMVHFWVDYVLTVLLMVVLDVYKTILHPITKHALCVKMDIICWINNVINAQINIVHNVNYKMENKFVLNVKLEVL